MKVKKIKLTNFRLHKKLEINCDDNCIVIVGNNASGKTTIVEAIYYCCFFTSFRIKSANELITFNEEISSVNLEYEKNNCIHHLDTYFNNEKRNIVYNGEKGKKRIEMMGEINVLLLTPNTDELVTSSPRVRRNFLDMYISQYNPLYKVKLLQYQKISKQRSACLKTFPTDMITLEIITEKYNKLISELRLLRVEFIKKINVLSNSIVSLLSQGTDIIELEYKQSKKETVEKEIKYGRNLYGLQYDDFYISLNTMSAKNYASQGQARSIAMALILSQLELLLEKYGEYPIVIVDDVHIELDKYRQEILFNLLNDKVQVFYVSTSLDNIPQKFKLKGKCFMLKNENLNTKIIEI